MATQRTLEMVTMRIATPPARAAFLRLEAQPFKSFLGLAKDYLGWCHNWEHQIAVQYDNSAQISYINNYLPMNLVQEVVGAHVIGIGQKVQKPADSCERDLKGIRRVGPKDSGQGFVPRFYALLWSMEARLEDLGNAEEITQTSATAIGQACYLYS